MKRRANANMWLLGILIAILGVIGIDVGQRMYAPAKADLRRPAVNGTPTPFKLGDLAPDFTLPASGNTKKSLSQVVHRDTLLTFTCGCASCRDMHSYLAVMLKQMGNKAPDVINVTSMSPESEPAWVRDTHLKQTFFFQPKEGPALEEMHKQFKGKDVDNVIDYYRGHPCPRIYRLNGERKVTWIGPSAATMPPIGGDEIMARVVASGLGFRQKGTRDDGKPVAPRFVSSTDMPHIQPASSDDDAKDGKDGKDGSAAPRRWTP